MSAYKKITYTATKNVDNYLAMCINNPIFCQYIPIFTFGMAIDVYLPFNVTNSCSGYNYIII
ncbi:MAG: hypothetical protein EBX41_04820 [Chitinophagia bacterium]|nr:hypothetical protein [Chitinophagia bacterium]